MCRKGSCWVCFAVNMHSAVTVIRIKEADCIQIFASVLPENNL